jgi:hypothetical protein
VLKPEKNANEYSDIVIEDGGEDLVVLGELLNTLRA